MSLIARALKARFKSLRKAVQGLTWLVRTQANARLHLIATLIVTITGLAIKLTTEQWGLLILALTLVWIAEAINTALENIADALYPAHHPMIGRAKDIAAAGVLLSAIGAVLIGILVLIERFA